MKDLTVNRFGDFKLFAYPGEIQSCLESRPETLISFELHPTNRCQSRCPKCFCGHLRADECLDFEEACAYMRQAAAMGAKSVIFSGGGEPLLHGDFVKMVMAARNIGLKVGVNTNGLALDLIDIESLVGAASYVRVSLDAGTAEMYQMTHGLRSGRYDRVLRNMSLLSAARNRTGSSCVLGSGYLTDARTVIFAEMDAFISVSAEAGLDFAQFRPFQKDFTPIEPHFGVLREKFRDDIRVVASMQKYGRFSDLNYRPYQKCWSHNFVTIIGADAKLYPCCELTLDPRYALGDLRQECFGSIWSKKEKIIRKIDIISCNPFCRGDLLNRAMAQINNLRSSPHSDFL